ncbi:putative extracellular salicylate hydroxylase/monooxygenase [Aspergillus coremiiformis]|uniref:Putative extracellular salicylate hydroxylase/monooxygenase n=1 Tax=Aspergillus coremiiformis TaxID=138285 RepID=A0A5N6ZCY5_9EURO|nr:putative extracellular salicylate hydroxylase/monooxygenase [Aspergillus coremiiformis]
MKIIIIGAGISGCTAYLQLQKHLPKLPQTDHEITIYEAYDTDKDTTSDERDGLTHSSTLIVGGGLGIGPNGLHVLKRLDEDLLREIVRGGYVVPTSNMKNKNGHLLIRMDASAEPTSPQESLPMHMLGCSRHWLWRCLRMRIPDHDIVTKRVAGVVANPEGRNAVHFVDESPPVEADLIIGADGLKGIVKRALFPEADEDPYPPQYEGLSGVGGFIPADKVKDDVEKGSMNFIVGGNGFFGYFYSISARSAPHRDSPYHVSEPGESLAWWSTYQVDECPNPKTIDKEDIARQLQERFGSWNDPVVRKILHTLDVSNMYPTWTMPPLPTWERNGVVLVGDAAHALPPTSGQGSSQALEDVEAFVLFLSHYIRKEHGDPDGDRDCKSVIATAAKQYMQLRIPRIQAILDDAKRRQNLKRDMGVVEEYMMYCFLWILGWFPSIFTRELKAVFNYNIAEEVTKVLAHGTSL